MRVTAALRNVIADPYEWLWSLNRDHLRHLAHRIGSNSADTKPMLIRRLRRDLHICEYRPARLPDALDPTKPVQPQEMRVLSLDTNYQNVGYAHFVVPRDERTNLEDPNRPLPSLTGWGSMDVKQMAELQREPDPTQLSSPSKTGTKRLKELDILHEQSVSGLATDAYARHAYNFVSSLFDAHNPTHVLIERQRLHPKADIDAALRRGMFEGMISASVYAVQRERGLRPFIQAIDPVSVAASIDLSLVPYVESPKLIRKMVMNEPKRARVDLAGRWLVDWAVAHDNTANTNGLSIMDEVHQAAGLDVEPEGTLRLPTPGATLPTERANPDFYRKLRISAEHPAARDCAVQYLKDWHVQLMRGRAWEMTRAAGSIQKRRREATRFQEHRGMYQLDDLAMSLVQGLVWLDWHVMRDRVNRFGRDGVQWSDRTNFGMEWDGWDGWQAGRRAVGK
ncbi:crossover junction endodeoxyribonuclease activity [Aspergillus sp. HF37]|nr:crossover junction endodeoxyribonuclease activity [Aspergillus sp. HF37]